MADHDHGYKLLFSHPEMVRDLLLGFVREDWVAHLDFDTLEPVNKSFVSDDLRERESDVVWRIRFAGEWAYVYLLLEFQSTVDRFMALRVMAYVALLYQDLVHGKQIGENGLLPPVLPVVLYNGERPWSAEVDVADLVIQVPGLEQYAPKICFLLLDQKRLESLDPSLRNLAGALFDLERARTTDDILLVVNELLVWLGEPAHEPIRRSFAAWFTRVLSKTRKEPVMVEGLSEVKTMLEQRMQEWAEQWKQDGLRQGIEQGIERGREEGFRLGEATILVRLLAARFGELPLETNSRVMTARVDELHAWSERILLAKSLDGVFDIGGD
jgi:predicted transposase/invertase (TIGR01784 family)